MNEDVLDMIDTLHARLDDVCEEVKALARPASEYVKRLDHIDDQIYALQCELEKLPHQTPDEVKKASAADNDDSCVAEAPQSEVAQSVGETSAHEHLASEGGASDAAQEAASESASSEQQAKTTKAPEPASSEKKEILTDEMKENLADAGRAVGHVLRDSKEVVSELSGTMNEIKDLFSFKPGKKH